MAEGCSALILVRKHDAGHFRHPVVGQHHVERTSCGALQRRDRRLEQLRPEGKGASSVAALLSIIRRNALRIPRSSSTSMMRLVMW
jgi:hypothetical protein